MRTFTKWYVHCHGVTQPADRNHDVSILYEYATDLLELHMTHHQPHADWLIGGEFHALKLISSPLGLFNPANMTMKWPEYAKIKHRGRTWKHLDEEDIDYDDYQRIQGSYRRGLEPWFDIRAYYARDFYVLMKPNGAFKIPETEGSKRINHLTSLYRNNLVREGLVDYRHEATFGGLGDQLPDKLDMPELPKLPNFPWSNENLPISAYCAHENVTAWAKLAVAPDGLEVLRMAWIAENLWVW
jgi:hypothetical protein